MVRSPGTAEDEVIIAIARAMTLVRLGIVFFGGLPGITVPPHLGWRMPTEGETV